MKGYLFSLGAMLVGAGLMFVLMHGEVRAEGEKAHCEDVGSDLQFCKVRNLTCVTYVTGSYSVRLNASLSISCVKKGISRKKNNLITLTILVGPKLLFHFEGGGNE